MICWTLGITEHHNAVDNVLALINLALLTGHVGRYGCGCNPLRGQNNVQGGGDMGALPNKLPGFQDVENDEQRTKFERAWGRAILPEPGLNLTEMIDAMDKKTLTALYVIGENPAQSDADSTHVTHLLEDLDHLVVQEIFLTKTAQLAHVVFPASATWAEGEGTVTNSERRVQRCRKAVEPPGEARDEIWIMAEIAQATWTRLGPPDRRRCVERGARTLAATRGHELRASRVARRAPVALSGRDRTRARSSSTRACGTTIPRSAAGWHHSRLCITKVQSSSRTTSIRSFSQPGVG